MDWCVAGPTALEWRRTCCRSNWDSSCGANRKPRTSHWPGAGGPRGRRTSSAAAAVDWRATDYCARAGARASPRGSGSTAAPGGCWAAAEPHRRRAPGRRCPDSSWLGTAVRRRIGAGPPPYRPDLCSQWTCTHISEPSRNERRIDGKRNVSAASSVSRSPMKPEGTSPKSLAK